MAPRRVGCRTGSCCTGHRRLPVVWSVLPRPVPFARSVPRAVNDRKLLLACRFDSIRALTVGQGSRSKCTFRVRHECTSCTTCCANSAGMEQYDRPRPGVSAIGFSETLNEHGRAVAGARGGDIGRSLSPQRPVRPRLALTGRRSREYRLLVSNELTGRSAAFSDVLGLRGRPLRPPQEEALQPDPRFVDWHPERCFAASLEAGPEREDADSSASGNPARQLSLQPVAIGADDGGPALWRISSLLCGTCSRANGTGTQAELIVELRERGQLMT